MCSVNQRSVETIVRRTVILNAFTPWPLVERMDVRVPPAACQYLPSVVGSVKQANGDVCEVPSSMMKTHKSMIRAWQRREVTITSECRKGVVLTSPSVQPYVESLVVHAHHAEFGKLYQRIAGDF